MFICTGQNLWDYTCNILDTEDGITDVVPYSFVRDRNDIIGIYKGVVKPVQSKKGVELLTLRLEDVDYQTNFVYEGYCFRKGTFFDSNCWVLISVEDIGYDNDCIYVPSFVNKIMCCSSRLVQESKLYPCKGIRIYGGSGIYDCQSMFQSNDNLEFIDLRFMTSNRINHVGSMFCDCRKLMSIEFGDWSKCKLNNLEYMFAGCIGLSKLDISSFNLNNVQSGFSSMFSNCTKLMSIKTPKKKFDVVADKYSDLGSDHMFYSCESLVSIDISFLNCKIQDMDGMFDGCLSLTSIDMQNIDLSQCYDMMYVFRYCASLKSVNLKYIKFSERFYKLANISGIFKSSNKTAFPEWFTKQLSRLIRRDIMK